MSAARRPRATRPRSPTQRRGPSPGPRSTRTRSRHRPRHSHPAEIARVRPCQPHPTQPLEAVAVATSRGTSCAGQPSHRVPTARLVWARTSSLVDHAQNPVVAYSRSAARARARTSGNPARRTCRSTVAKPGCRAEAVRGETLATDLPVAMSHVRAASRLYCVSDVDDPRTVWMRQGGRHV
jgi:hypothetical protein